MSRIQIFGVTCLAMVTIALSAWSANAQAGVPLIAIKAVVRNESVTISGSQFPPNQSFSVRMGPYGSYGLGGVLLSETVNSGNGTFEAVVSIPAEMKDFSRIHVRFDNGIYNSYNWFFNTSTGAAAPTPTEEVKTGDAGTNDGTTPGKAAEPAKDQVVYTGIPSLTIEKVEGEEVTVRTGNFPPNQTFYVSMGSYAAAGSGPSVGTITSGDGSDASHTFTIPASIAYYGYILVRSQTGHAYPNAFYATVGFNNPSHGVIPEVKSSAQPKLPEEAPDVKDTKPVLWLGDPTLTTCIVEGGKTVTVVAKNLPTNLEYTVRMGAYGTLGLNGEVVGTISPDDKASVAKMFKIPTSLSGHSMIAIRADAGIYHAFEFFYNRSATVCEIPVAK
jgi:hypothetical protein